MTLRALAAALTAAMLIPCSAAQTNTSIENARELRAAGKPVEAAALLRTRLASDPADGRARLQLALALEEAGDLLAARYHLELALGADLTATETEQALITLRKIRERSTTSSFFLTTLAPVKSRTVINADGSNRTIIGESSYGLGASGSARLALGAERRYFARGSVDWRDYGGSLDDFSFGQASAGRIWSIDRAALTAEAGVLASAYQGQHWYTGGLVQLGETFYVDAQTTWSSVLLGRRIEFTELKGATTNQGYVHSDIRWARSGALTLGIGGTLGISNASDEWRGFDYGELRGSVLKELSRGWIVELHGAAGVTRYAAIEPGFTVTRRDVTRSLGIDVTWREITVFRLAPRVSVSRARTGSNVASYDSGRTSFVFGLTSSY